MMPLGAQVAAEHLDRVVVTSLLHLIARPIGLVVIVGGMAQEAIGLALDQRRAFACPSLVRAPASSPRSRRARRSRRRRRRGTRILRRGRRRPRSPSARLGHADRVAVVLAHEDHGKPMDAGEVEAFVPVALAGGSVPEPAPHHGILLAVFDRVGDAGGVRDLGRDGRGAADDLEFRVPPVRRHLSPTGRWVVGLGEDPRNTS